MKATHHLEWVRRNYGNSAESRVVSVIDDRKQVVTLGRDLWETLDFLEKGHALNKEAFFSFCVDHALRCAGPFDAYFPHVIDSAIRSIYHLVMEKPKLDHENDNQPSRSERETAWIGLGSLPRATQKRLMPSFTMDWN